jgi:hypothetical protein
MPSSFDGFCVVGLIHALSPLCQRWAPPSITNDNEGPSIVAVCCWREQKQTVNSLFLPYPLLFLLRLCLLHGWFLHPCGKRDTCTSRHIRTQAFTRQSITSSCVKKE